MITSTQNSKVKRIHGLVHQQKDRNLEKVFIIEGKKMMEEVPKEWIEEIYVTPDYLDKEGVKPYEGVSVEVVSDKVYQYFSDFVTPQGILGVIKQKHDQLKALNLSGQSSLILLENIQDPGNLGTILRTAEAIGVQGVIMTKGCVDLYNPKVVRATMGSILRLKIVTHMEIGEAACYLKEKGVPLYAAHLNGSKYYFEFDYTGPVCFMIGNEGNGLTNEATEMATELVKIPMIGQAESLNASIAAGVLMYEIVRQRMQ